MMVFAVVTFAQASRIDANQPTPWLGIEERVLIYAQMLWVAALAVGLWRAQGATAPSQREQPTVTP